ncbi:MATE family efflux transporter [Cohnella mopanensis]|uniref:MATE family efflux transporter n=1 Tax=Cohnella mopanensis TaxID=2911966 RepID=UPI001EF7F436|nr:MATE family efflux transporter [Cohnella mopanensis]
MEKKRSLWALSWPVMIEMFLQFAIGTADTLMVSRISDDAVAVVGFSNQFFNAVLIMFMLVASGAGILISQRLGAGLRTEARTIGTMAIVLTGGLGVVVSVVLLFGTGQFAAALQMPEEIRPLGHTYMSIVGGGMVFTALNAALSTCVRNTGDTRSPMYIAFAMNVLHITLNALFIFGALGFPKWGLFGVAISTLFVRVLAVILLLRLFRHAFETPITWREFGKFDFRLLKDVFKIGWPMSVNGASWQVSQLAITSLIGVMGAQALAARTYMNTMESFAFTIGWSLAMAVQIQIAHEYGAGRYREAYYSCYRVLGIGMALVLMNTGLILLFRESILNFFTTDPWIVDMAVTLLWLNLLLQPGKMLNMALGQSINAIGDGRFSMKVSLPCMWIVAVGLTYLLGISLEWGLYGVYAGMILDEYARGIFMWFRWRHHRKSGVFASAFRQPLDRPLVTGSGISS